MDFDNNELAITPSVLHGSSSTLSSGALATTVGQHHSLAHQDHLPHSSNPEVSGTDGYSSQSYSEALERRQLSNTGGALIPTLQRNNSLGAVVIPDTTTANTRAWLEAPELSPTKSMADASSIMSYGSSMKDEERRAKLKAKMEKVGKPDA